jgi:3-oxoacyl-[acyl-carrier-protein] synthase II
VQAIKRALAQARLSPKDIDYISAHGTGTKWNDRMEAIAVKKVFGERHTPISSIKALVGHTLGAAAALEAVACCMTIKEGIIPPTWNYQEPDPCCDLDVVPNEPRQAELHAIISNSYAFGGNNSSIVLGRYDG